MCQTSLGRFELLLRNAADFAHKEFLAVSLHDVLQRAPFLF